MRRGWQSILYGTLRKEKEPKVDLTFPDLTVNPALPELTGQPTDLAVIKVLMASQAQMELKARAALRPMLRALQGRPGDR